MLADELHRKLNDGDRNVERWVKFHEENPHVYEKLEEICEFVYGRGLRRIGISFIWERLRWVSKIKSQGDPYKLNNTFRAFYARQLMWDHKEWGDLFETRSSPHDSNYGERVAAVEDDEEPPDDEDPEQGDLF